MFNGKATFDINKLVTTSKMALKLSCLNACNNDIRRADELYEYIMKDLKELPDTEPVIPSGIQRFKTGADDIIGWISEHKDLIQQGLSLIKGFRKSGGNGVAGVAPIPKM